MMDGGIRRGHDIVKALALGAKACLIGRGYAYGLAANGQAGVEQSVEILRSEMSTTMGMLACSKVDQIERGLLHDNQWRLRNQADRTGRQRNLLAVGEAG